MELNDRVRRIGKAWNRVIVVALDNLTENMERYCDAMRPPTCPYCHARMMFNSMTDGSEFWWTCECKSLPEELKDGSNGT